MKHEKTQIKSSPIKAPSKISVCIFWITSVAVALFLCVAFFYWTIVPYIQSNSYLDDMHQAFTTGDFSIFNNDQIVFDPDSNVQGILRSDFLRQILTQYNNGNFKTPTPLLDKGISEMEEYVSNHINYYTYVVGLANAYSLKSGMDNDPKSFAAEEKYFKQAMDIIPGRQDVAYSYAVSLLKQKRSDEAVAIIQQLIDKNPEIYTSNYQLGELYMMMGEDHYTQALGQFEIALSHDVDSNPDFTKSVYQELLRSYYSKNDTANFLTVVNRLVSVDPNQKNAYDGVLDYMKLNNKIPKLNIGPNK